MEIGRGKYRVKVGYHFCVESTQIRARRLFNGFTRMHVWTNTHTAVRCFNSGSAQSKGRCAGCCNQRKRWFQKIAAKQVTQYHMPLINACLYHLNLCSGVWNYNGIRKICSSGDPQ